MSEEINPNPTAAFVAATVSAEPQIEADPTITEPIITSADETFGRSITVCFAGVGTCGANMLMNLKTQNSKNEIVDFVGIHSDGGTIKRLKENGFNRNIALSMGDDYYLGAGGDLEIAKKLGERHYDKFKERFKDMDLILVVTGMGGGTGTGVAPLVAKAAKEVQAGKQNKLTIGVTTIPSVTEFDKRELAKQGVEELKKYVDALVVIDNLYLSDVLEQETASVDQADYLIDSKFQIVLQSILDTVTKYTKKNIDFADVCSCLKTCGEAIITTIETSAEKIDDIKSALEKNINDKLLINHSDKVATRLLAYHFFDTQYAGADHEIIDNEVKRLLGWTEGREGKKVYYRCAVDNKVEKENFSKFLKVSTVPDDAYKGKMKIIVMAGGFVDKIDSPEIPQPVISKPELTPKLEVANEDKQTTKTALQPTAPITAPIPTAAEQTPTATLPITETQPTAPITAPTETQPTAPIPAPTPAPEPVPYVSPWEQLVSGKLKL